MAELSLAQEKARWRKEMTHRRQDLDPMRKNIYDESVCEELHRIILEKGYKRIHTYIPIKNEFFLEPLLMRLLDHKDISLYAPVVQDDGELEHRKFTSFETLEIGVLGTKFPALTESYDGDFDLIIVPGLAFDKEGHRLGYGGGYYDRFLAKRAGAYTIAPAYPFQMIPKIPTGPHDQKVDRVLTLSSF